MTWLAEWFQLVLAASWRAGLLILLLLAARRFVRGRIPEQVLFAGWIVVALRLLIPFGVPTAWSPYNLAKPIARVANEATAASFLGQPDVVASPAPGSVAGTTRRDGLARSRLAQALASGWAVGALVLLAARLRASSRFRRRLGTGSGLVDGRVAAIVQRCGRELGLRPEAIAVHVTDAAPTPALYGILKPRLLLPVGFAEQLADDELRLVILHELGHWRRRDLLVQLILQLARIIHWFNPLVWIATQQARTDCELACDEFVLRRQKPSTAPAYGHTLLKVLGNTRRPASNPIALGIVEDRRQLRERIRRIAGFRLFTLRRFVLGGALVGILTIVSVTHETWAQEAVQSVATALTQAPPDGWRRISAGNSRQNYEVGVDPSQPWRGHPATAYVKALVDEGNLMYRGFAQACLADDFRGRRVRFSAWARTENVCGGAGLWLRVDGYHRHGLQFDNMSNRPIAGTTAWTLYSVVLDVPDEAVSLNYGFSIHEGTGQAWFSEPRLEVVAPDVPSTNTARAPPTVCANPTCSSSICAAGALRHSIINPHFVAGIRP